MSDNDTHTTEPTVVLIIDGHGFTKDDGGEVLEAEPSKDGAFDWDDAGICDHRGVGGMEGYMALRRAIDEAEDVVSASGTRIRRVGE